MQRQSTRKVAIRNIFSKPIKSGVFALVAGGYKFEAKAPEIALVGIRALLRKRTNIFHKLPNNTYGLTEWYPGAKAPKGQNETADSDEEPADD